jgi:murein DD-endopeptidase MepM/ murein hydrolase activator NlpD
MKKKIILIVLSLLSSMSLFFIILIACLTIFDSDGETVTDDYVENNSKYASKYLQVINKHLSKGDGYVSLSRIVYFYKANDKLTFDEIYEDNLDKKLKQVKPISEVCLLPKYKSLYVCDNEYPLKDNQIDIIQNKPFVPPLKISNMHVTSYFKHDRIVYGKVSTHQGWDFSSPAKTDVYSSCDGEVTFVSFGFFNNSPGSSGGGGNQIKIKCDPVGDEVYTITYMHLYPNSSKVKNKSRVAQGQHIAEVGTTGYSTGNHLHFQVANSKNKVVDGLSLINFN